MAGEDLVAHQREGILVVLLQLLLAVQAGVAVGQQVLALINDLLRLGGGQHQLGHGGVDGIAGGAHGKFRAVELVHVAVCQVHAQQALSGAQVDHVAQQGGGHGEGLTVGGQVGQHRLVARSVAANQAGGGLHALVPEGGFRIGAEVDQLVAVPQRGHIPGLDQDVLIDVLHVHQAGVGEVALAVAQGGVDVLTVGADGIDDHREGLSLHAQAERIAGGVRYDLYQLAVQIVEHEVGEVVGEHAVAEAGIDGDAVIADGHVGVGIAQAGDQLGHVAAVQIHAVHALAVLVAGGVGGFALIAAPALGQGLVFAAHIAVADVVNVALVHGHLLIAGVGVAGGQAGVAVVRHLGLAQGLADGGDAAVRVHAVGGLDGLVAVLARGLAAHEIQRAVHVLQAADLAVEQGLHAALGVHALKSVQGEVQFALRAEGCDAARADILGEGLHFSLSHRRAAEHERRGEDGCKNLLHIILSVSICQDTQFGRRRRKKVPISAKAYQSFSG